MKVRITKLAPSYKPVVETANNIEQFQGGNYVSPPVNYWVEGTIIRGFAEGECLELTRYVKNGVESLGYFNTSRIEKIHWDLGKFETRNSIYKFEFLPETQQQVKFLSVVLS